MKFSILFQNSVFYLFLLPTRKNWPPFFWSVQVPDLTLILSPYQFYIISKGKSTHHTKKRKQSLQKMETKRVRRRESFKFSNRTRFAIMVLSTVCLSLVISNSVALNFTIICMKKPISTTNVTKNDALRQRSATAKFYSEAHVVQQERDRNCKFYTSIRYYCSTLWIRIWRPFFDSKLPN